MPVADRDRRDAIAAVDHAAFKTFRGAAAMARLMVRLLRGFGVGIRLEAELAPHVREFLRVRQAPVRHHRA